MGILFAGGEPNDFDTFTATDSGNNATSLARRSILCQDESFARVMLSEPSSDAWLACRLYKSGASQAAQRGILTFLSGAQYVAGFGTTDGTNGEWHAVVHDQAAGEFVSEATIGFETGRMYALAVHVIIAEQGLIEWFVDEASVAKVEMDTSSFGPVDELEIKAASTSALSAHRHWFNEIIAADFDIRTFRLRTLVVNSNGGEQDWSGAAGDISGINSPEETFVASEAADAVSTFDLSPQGADLEFGIYAVRLNARFRRDGGPERVAGVARFGGDNYHAGETGVPRGAGFDRYSFSWLQDPASQGPWTNEALNSLELGFVSRDG